MKKKLIRLTTIDNSLNILLKGQLKYLNKTFEVIGVANDSGVLSSVAKREGIRTIGVPMQRKISIIHDLGHYGHYTDYSAKNTRSSYMRTPLKQVF